MPIFWDSSNITCQASLLSFKSLTNVKPCPIDFICDSKSCGITGEVSAPLAYALNIIPFLPNLSLRIFTGNLAKLPIVWTPIELSLRFVAGPT